MSLNLNILRLMKCFLRLDRERGEARRELGGGKLCRQDRRGGHGQDCLAEPQPQEVSRALQDALKTKCHSKLD